MKMLSKVKIHLSNEKAFTLIEVIVSLVLVGILAAIAGMGLIKIAEGYVFAKQNAEATQKGQIAIARIVKELSAAEKATAAATPITAAGAASVTYTRQESPGSATFTTNIIAFSGSTVTVKLGAAAAVPLIDNVTALALTYLNAAGANSAANLPNIRRIDISLALNGANGQALPAFTNTIYIQQNY